jgi:NADPH:quinone reductase-like Zn-dependent oxidoreductase
LLTKDEWQDKLLQASFAGIEHVGHESGESPKSSMMVIKATDTIKEKSPVAKIKVFQGSQSALTQTLSHALCSGLEAKSFPVSAVAWDPSAVQAVGTDVYVVLDNSNQPILPDPSADEFEALKSLLTKCRSLLWVSFHESDSDHAAAMQGLVTGMARVVRRENEGVRFITLDVKDALTSEVNPLVDAILKVAETWFWPKSKADSSDEDEYAFSNARLEIPRIHTDFEFNKWVDRVNKQAKAETHLYQDLNQPFKLEAETPGLLSSLRFVHDELPSSPLRPDQIQIEALAYGVNFRDVFIALGQMPAYLPMIGEVCGVVTVVGSDPDTQSRFKVGDRVAGLSWCPFSSYPRLRSLHARVVPDSITSVVAASIPIVYLTAYHSLIDIARLQKGQTILIHSASGGVGQAAIRIAQHIGAEIFATVGSAKKRNFVMANYGIPESHIFSSRTSTRTFKQGIMRLTANKGVDVVLNSLAGEMLAESWECLAEFGTHLEIGKADIYKRSHLSMAPLDRSTTFAAIDLFRLLQGRAQQMWDILGKVFDLVQEGVIAPVQPLNILPMDQIEPAFRLISDRKHIGKVILEVKKDTLVKAILPPPSPLQLDPHGTYVIAGGLGDLGRRMCRLLASRGAGHIVTLSRHILDDTARAELEDSVRQLGGQLHIEKCDITDRSRVEAVAERCRRLLPPIKGIIHGGMVLRVRHRILPVDDYEKF